jgi:hypothetical protein
MEGVWPKTVVPYKSFIKNGRVLCGHARAVTRTHVEVKSHTSLATVCRLIICWLQV